MVKKKIETYGIDSNMVIIKEALNMIVMELEEATDYEFGNIRKQIDKIVYNKLK